MKKVSNAVHKIDLDYYLTEENIDRLKKMITGGATISEIGKNYFQFNGASNRTINTHIKEIIGAHSGEYLEYTKIDLYLSLKDKGFSILDMAKYEGTTSQVIKRRIERFKNEMDDYFKFKQFEENQIKNIKFNNSQNNKLVTKDFYKPIIMSALFLTGKDKNRRRLHYYVPELNAWFPSGNVLKTRLKNNGIDYLSWECRWLLELDIDEIGSNIWAKRKTEYYYSNKGENTKDYIAQNLLRDPYYEPNYFTTKEDFIVDFTHSRKIAGARLYKFNFDLLPKEIKTVDTLVDIIIEEENPKTGIPYNEVWSTTYSNSVKNLSNPLSLSIFELYSKNREERKKSFIERAKVIHGNKYSYHLVKYWDANTPVEIWCNSCGKSFFQDPQSHLNGQGCPTCRNKYFSSLYLNDPVEMKKKLEAMYSPRYDFSKMVYTGLHNKVIVIDTETGLEFERTPGEMFHGNIGEIKESSGELLVKTWLNTNNIVYTKQVSYTDPIFTSRITRTIVADFVIKIDNKEVILEYHGRQHYSNERNPWGRTEDDFELQKLRDEQLREFCKINTNPNLIETPYILDNYDKVNEFLTQVILNNVDPNTLIDYNKLYN